jgi:hypothetical protein
MIDDRMCDHGNHKDCCDKCTIENLVAVIEIYHANFERVVDDIEQSFDLFCMGRAARLRLEYSLSKMEKKK